MTAVRITEPMADTILAAVKRDTGEYVVRARVQTENALSARGLIDYGDDYAFLTPSGVWVLEYMRSGGNRRAWTVDELDAKPLDAPAEAVLDMATRWYPDDFTAGSRVSDKTGQLGTVLGYWNGSVTNPDHENFGREYIGVKWDDGKTDRPFVDELRMDIQRNPDQFPVTEPAPPTCDSVTRDGMSVHACYLPSGHYRDHTNGIKTWSLTEYSVKIWYRSGAYEGAPHCPEELARKIFADAVKSSGVEFAELHGPSGKLVESKVPNENRSRDAEQIAQKFHEAYEELAPDFGYSTREASRKPWADVPDQNKSLMTAVARRLLDMGTVASGSGSLRGLLREGHVGVHGPSGKLVESKTPNEEQHVSTETDPYPNAPEGNGFLAGLSLLHPEPLPPAPEIDDRDAACVAGDED